MDNSGGTSANIQASLAGRYATALFELAREQGSIDAVERSLSDVVQAIGESADLKALTTNPVVTRLDAQRAISAVSSSMKLDGLRQRRSAFLPRTVASAKPLQLPGPFQHWPHRIAAK